MSRLVLLLVVNSAAPGFNSQSSSPTGFVKSQQPVWERHPVISKMASQCSRGALLVTEVFVQQHLLSEARRAARADLPPRISSLQHFTPGIVWISVCSFWSSSFSPEDKCPRFFFHAWMFDKDILSSIFLRQLPFLLLRRLWCWYEVHVKGPAWAYVLLLLSHAWKLYSLQSWGTHGQTDPLSFLALAAALGDGDVPLSWISCRRCSWKAAGFPAYQLANTGTGCCVTGSAWAGRSRWWLGKGKISTFPAVKAHKLCFMFCGFKIRRENSCFSMSFLVQPVEVEDRD